MTVTDPGGSYNGSAFPATATVAGIGGTPGASLEGVTPTLVLLQGHLRQCLALTGQTASVHGRRPRPAPTPSWPPSPAAPTTPAPRQSPTSPSPRSTPSVTVTDAGGHLQRPPRSPPRPRSPDWAARPAPVSRASRRHSTYYNGTYTSPRSSPASSRLQPRRSTPAPTPSWPASPAAPTTPAASTIANFTIAQVDAVRERHRLPAAPITARPSRPRQPSPVSAARPPRASRASPRRSPTTRAYTSARSSPA